MPKLIDLDKLFEYPIRINRYDKENGNEDFVLGVESVLEYAENLPAVEAAPVVRCRDCKYRTKDTRWTRAGFCGRRGAGDFYVANPDGFCSYGERSKDETD